MKTKSAGDGYSKKAIEKTVLRFLGSRTFSHGLDPKQPSGAASGGTSASGVSCHSWFCIPLVVGARRCACCGIPAVRPARTGPRSDGIQATCPDISPRSTRPASARSIALGAFRQAKRPPSSSTSTVLRNGHRSTCGVFGSNPKTTALRRPSPMLARCARLGSPATVRQRPLPARSLGESGLHAAIGLIAKRFVFLFSDSLFVATAGNRTASVGEPR